jgi:hypothetical protein
MGDWWYEGKNLQIKVFFNQHFSNQKRHLDSCRLGKPTKKFLNMI